MSLFRDVTIIGGQEGRLHLMDDTKKWDLKQVGTGVGGSVVALLLLQGQGIDLMNQKQESANQVIIEKTLGNTGRIDRLEVLVREIENKISSGFDKIQSQMKDDSNSLREMIRLSTLDFYTKSEQRNYSQGIDTRIRRAEEEIDFIKDKTKIK